MTTQILHMKARLENFPEILGFVLKYAEGLGWTENRLGAVELAIEEAVVNVCKYAYPDEEGMVAVSCDGNGDALHIVITDRGVPFDLLSAAEPDLDADISERRIGGLGCFLIRKLADTVTYNRNGDENVLKLTFLAEKEKKDTSDDE